MTNPHRIKWLLIYTIEIQEIFLVFPRNTRALKSLNWCYTLVIYVGKINVASWKEELLKLMKRPPRYGALLIEGVVIKSYSKHFLLKL